MASGLSDMEELLGKVANPAIADYLKEAFACYGTGAHRACIVLTFIAVFEDLRAKTKTLASVNSKAKAISKDIEVLANGQKPFENQLVEQLQSNDLISELQGQKLKQIILHRNKAAHPSGHHASAEEARYVFFEAIDKYLRHPALSTNHAVDRIIERLVDGNYFPDNNMANISSITAEEVGGIHPEAYGYLTIKVVASVASADTTLKKNARFFLSGMARMDDPALLKVLMEKFVTPKASNPIFSDEIATAISAGPTMIEHANATTISRLNSLLEKVVKETTNQVPVTKLKHPISILKAMLSNLDEPTFFPGFQSALDKAVAKFWKNAELVDALSNSEKAFSQLRRLFLEKAGSSDFGTANEFAAALPDLEQKLSEAATRQFAVKLLGSVVVAADIGAYKAQSLRSNKFASVGALRARALAYIDNKPEKATAALKGVGLNLSAENFKTTYLSEVNDTNDDG